MSEVAGDSLERFEDSHGEIREAVEEAAGLVVCTDFDGTLAPIEEDPDAPEIDPENRELLERLRDAGDTRVAVVSGRALTDVRERVGVEGIAYAGNHGLELEREGSVVVHPIAKRHADRIERICEALSEALAGIDGTGIEDKGVTATIHYRQTPDEAVPVVREAVDDAVERFGGSGIEKTDGKEIVELRPEVRWHKGMAVSMLVDDHPDDWLPIYIGDDTTDESAFRAVDDGLAIYVGTGETDAHYRVPTQSGVTPCLSALAEWHAGTERRPRADGIER
ncbi:trehalose-phosphatase [Halalkalicoccus tibetensis]|uniref:Trehalose 6-phosphate phosphatase n=1 Tax=Halalkalicoccus tibetensis TaxID=175632 RepID=A0ABD5V3M3_9EURY